MRPLSSSWLVVTACTRPNDLAHQPHDLHDVRRDGVKNDVLQAHWRLHASFSADRPCAPRSHGVIELCAYSFWHSFSSCSVTPVVREINGQLAGLLAIVLQRCGEHGTRCARGAPLDGGALLESRPRRHRGCPPSAHGPRGGRRTRQAFAVQMSFAHRPSLTGTAAVIFESATLTTTRFVTRWRSTCLR